MFFTGHRDQSTPSTVYVTQNSNSSRETEEAGLLDPHDREVCIQSMERKRSHFLSFFLNIHCLLLFIRDNFPLRDNGDKLVLAN